MTYIFKKSYTTFTRHILAEFMTKKELEKIDHQYNLAKLELAKRKYAQAIKDLEKDLGKKKK